MTEEDVTLLICESVARGSCTPTLRTPRDEYIRQEQERLLACVIPPTEASVTEETFHYGVLDEIKNETLFAVAHSGQHWLLYRPLKKEFCLAIGENPSSLTILGFSSSDALAEWLG